MPDSVSLHPTRAEIDKAMREMADELDLEVSMALLASLEAVFMTDFLDRVRRRLKDPATRDLRALQLKSGRRQLSEILNVWRRHTGHPRFIGDLRQFFGRRGFRHWLAHGRYFTLARQPKPDEVWEVGRRVLGALPGFPALVP